jgi:glycosyltransferase involved in cell wall biosynthesis
MVLSILFLGSQMTVGGAQRVLFNQAQWFHEKGYAVTAAFFYDKDGLRGKWEAAYPFPVLDLRGRRWNGTPLVNFALLIGGVIRLWKLLRRNRFDVIETFTPDSNLLGLVVARLAGVPVRIASHHGYIEGLPEWRKRAHGWLVNAGFASCLVAVSEQVRRIALEEEAVRPDKLVVILNGIEMVKPKEDLAIIKARLRQELVLDPDDFIYFSVGRVTVQKGHTYLLEAVPKVLERFPEHTVFLIAGEGHLRESLEAKATQLGIGRVVRFLGNRMDVSDLLFLVDVFVLPSLWEGLPLALLEAMSAGLPTIATRVEGVENIISNGENGYLLQPKDVAALAGALIRIREDPLTRRTFGERNKALVQNEFTIDRMCSCYEALFQRFYQQETTR